MVAVVRATATQFDSDLKQASRSIDQFASHANSTKLDGGVFGALKGGGLGGATGAGLAAGAAFAASMLAVEAAVNGARAAVGEFFATASRADQIGDFAKQIGSTAEELTSLRLAATLSDAGTDSLDNALGKLEQKLGEARQGAESTSLAFKALGLDANKLAGMTTGEALKEIADGFQQVKSPADQAAIAVDLFGKQGASLINLLKEGRDGIEGFQNEARRLGAVLTNEDAAAFGEFQNAIERLSLAWDGFKNQIFATVAPAVTFLVDALTELIGAVNRALAYWRDFTGLIGEPINMPSIAAGDNIIDQLKRAEKEADDAQKAIADTMKRGAQITESLRLPTEVFADSMHELQDLLNAGAINWETFQRAVQKAGDELQRTAETKKELDRFRATPGVSAELQGTSGAFSAIQQSVRAQADESRRQELLAQKQLDEQKKQSDLQKQMVDALKSQAPLQVVSLSP